MINVLFVCTANICRSPMAQALFERLVKEAGLESDFYIDSAGTHGFSSGQATDEYAQLTLQRHGLASTHVARQVSLQDFHYFDYIIAMDSGNFAHLISNCTSMQSAKISLLLSYIPQEAKGELDVPDPYQGGESGFEYVHQLIDKGVIGLLKVIKKDRGIT